MKSIISEGRFPWPDLFNKMTLWVAITSIAGLEAYAISKGINGILLTAVIAAIVGVVAYIAPSPIKSNSNK